MKLSIKHQTHYLYDQPVVMGLQRVRLEPHSDASQNVNHWQIDVEGAKVEARYQDQFANNVQLLKLAPETQNVRIQVEGEVETFNGTGIYGEDARPLPRWFYLMPTELTQLGAGLKKLAKSYQDNDGSVGFFHELVNEIRSHVNYETGVSHVDTPAENAWEQAAGVCQDHSHIMITISRALGYPARYVSGYLLMNDTIDQAASHAWCEVQLDGLGWVGFDVSNGYSPDERYVRIATGRDYQDAAPIHGLRYGQAKEVLDVRLQIQQ